MLQIILLQGFCPLKIKITQFPGGFRLDDLIDEIHSEILNNRWPFPVHIYPIWAEICTVLDLELDWDQIAFCVFHSVLVEVQTNAGYIHATHALQ